MIANIKYTFEHLFYSTFWKDKLNTILAFNPEDPMLFTNIFFWFFFAFVLIGYSIIYKKRTIRNAFLFFVSIFFYWKTSGIFILILLFSTITDYGIGLFIGNVKKNRLQKLGVTVSIIINLSVLIFFKYAYFFTESFNTLFLTDYTYFNHFAHFSNQINPNPLSVDRLIVPVGISFFTFQTISYAIDVYKQKIPPVKNILDFGFYVSFFPQLVAGPIVRAADFIPQLYKKHVLSSKQFSLALYWILKGFFKKIVLGDYIAVQFIDRVFEQPTMYSGYENLMALYGYSLQVYADFSGYTDMAIGIALLMGFHLPRNFNSPYKARSVGDFWKRWHISLSNWLKDYLYIPLGGNRKASFFTYIGYFAIAILTILYFKKVWVLYSFIWLTLVLLLIGSFFPKTRKRIFNNLNLLITMLLGGLWHGASWQFIIWGALNGIGLMIYKMWRKISPYETSTNVFVLLWKIFFTFQFITFTRIWFRSQTMQTVNDFFHQIRHQFSFELIPSINLNYAGVFSLIIFGYIIHILPSKWKRWMKIRFICTPKWGQFCITIVIILITFQAMTSESQPFIYFQF